MGNERERVISITLSEAEWQAFVARQPQPVDWLRQQIRSQVDVTPPRKESQSAAFEPVVVKNTRALVAGRTPLA